MIAQEQGRDRAAGDNRLYGIVLLSDGKDTANEISETRMFQICLASQVEGEEGPKMFVISFGDETDVTLLKRLAQDPNGGAVHRRSGLDRRYLSEDLSRAIGWLAGDPGAGELGAGIWRGAVAASAARGVDRGRRHQHRHGACGGGGRDRGCGLLCRVIARRIAARHLGAGAGRGRCGGAVQGGLRLSRPRQRRRAVARPPDSRVRREHAQGQRGSAAGQAGDRVPRAACPRPKPRLRAPCRRRSAPCCPRSTPGWI